MQNEEEGFGFIVLGLIAIAIIAFLGAYGLEAAAECVRSNAAAINSKEINSVLDPHSSFYRVMVSGACALVLYGALRLFSYFFHKIELPVPRRLPS